MSPPAACAFLGHSFVFVGGLHRSGTSLLARALGAHPAVSVFSDTGVPADEGQHLQSVYPTARAYGGPGAFGFARAAHLTESSPLVSERNRERLLEEWGPHWDLRRPFLLEKSPPNLIRTRFLQALFPGSYFLVVVRHPVPVSLATQKWRLARRRGSRRNRFRSRSSLSSLLAHWLVCHETFAADSVSLERLQLVRYEDFVRDPRACLEHVYAFLGLEAAPTTLEVRTDSNARYLADWRARGAGLPGRAYLELLRRRFGARVERWGYSLSELESVARDVPAAIPR